MSMRRVIAMVSVPVVALGIACEKETREEPPEYTVTGVSLPTVMTVCPYVQSSADTLEITALEQLTCDSAGAPAIQPRDTVWPWFALRSDSLMAVSLQGVSPIIRRIVAGPSFDPAVAGFLDILDSVPESVTRIEGIFKRLEGDSGMTGLWRFAGIEPEEFANVLPGEMAETYRSMIADVEGNAAMMFEFGADTLRGLLSRRTYGDEVLGRAVDITGRNVTLSFVADSTWRLTGGVVAGPVEVVADSVGDLHWSLGDSGYVYRQFPQQCPDPVTPSWLTQFLAANPR